MLPFSTHVLLFVLSLNILGTAIPQSTSESPQENGLASVGQQALRVVLNHYIADPTKEDGPNNLKKLQNGKWGVGTTRPLECPNTTETCVLVVFRLAPESRPCEWVVLLTGDGLDGTVVSQNDETSKYFATRISSQDARDLLVTFEKPAYPSAAISKRISGSVEASIFVAPDGSVEHVTVIQGPDSLRSATFQAMQHASFKPLIVGSRAAAFQTTLTMHFEIPKGSGPVVSGP